MKTFRLFLVLFCAFFAFGAVTSQAAAPLTAAERAKVTGQRDALLGQLVAKLGATQTELEQSQSLHRTDALEQARLQATTDAMTRTINAQAAEITDLKASLARWKRIVASAAAAIALLLCLWLDVPKLATPYGPVGTCLAPVLVYEVLMRVV